MSYADPPRTRQRERRHRGLRSFSVLTTKNTSPRPPSKKAGFTLFELLIYVGIFAIAAGLMTGVLTTLTRVEVRENASVEVSTQAQFVIQRVQQLIRDSSIVELTKDTPTSLLKLRMPTVATDPTCVQLSNGTVYLMQGNDGVNKQSCLATSTAQAKTLTDSKVVVNTLTFTRFSNPPAKDTTQVNLTVTYNSTNPQESIISRTLETAITKVSAAVFDSDIIPSADNVLNVGIGAQRWLNGYFSNNVTVGGKVGIGTASPLSNLDVAGYLHVSGNTNPSVTAQGGYLGWNALTGGTGETDFINNQGGGSGGFAFMNTPLAGTPSTTLMVINGSGNVGIGTVSPAAKLEVVGGVIRSSGVNPIMSLNGTGQLTWQMYSSDGGVDQKYAEFNQVSGGDVVGRFVNDAYNAASDWLHAVRNAGTYTTKYVYFPNGNVGIGITSPSSKLQVSGGDVGLGNATATGNQPVTVWLTNASGVTRSAGEIVIISAGNAFTTTATAADYRVLGIVYDSSIAAGAVGRIAVGGVASVLSAGAVTAGNYLITSATAGKATDATSLVAGQSAVGRWLETLGAAGTGRALIKY